MALGNTYNNNTRSNDVYSPTVYSPYKMTNAEGEVDKTRISFNFWNNTLKISISPRKDTIGPNGEISFDYQNGISIYLNYTKARILAEEIKNFIKDPVTYDNSGVPSGQGLITVSRGTEFNSPSPIIVIRKIDENGNVMSSFAYQTKHDYHYAVRGYNENGEFNKETESYKNIELLQFVTILEEFYKAATGAIAYTVLDQFKWEHNHMREWRNSVSAKLGIDTGYNKGSNGGNYSSSSYFNNSSGRSNDSSASSGGYTRATLDDID